jgi:hypothetical protein
MQFETVLVARIPKVNYPEHGVKTIEVLVRGRRTEVRKWMILFPQIAP